MPENKALITGVISGGIIMVTIIFLSRTIRNNIIEEGNILGTEETDNDGNVNLQPVSELIGPLLLIIATISIIALLNRRD